MVRHRFRATRVSKWRLETVTRLLAALVMAEPYFVSRIKSVPFIESILVVVGLSRFASPLA